MTPKRIHHRLCTKGYARILRGLYDAPAGSQELAVRHGTAEHTMRGITRRLHYLGLIRIVAWRAVVQGPAIRIFGFGGGADAPRPFTIRGLPSQHIGVTARPPAPRLELTSFAVLMRALAEKRGQRELIEITGIARSSLSPNLRYMRSIGLLFIAGWERRDYGGGAALPLYQLGIGRNDVSRPRPELKTVINARYGAARTKRRAQDRLTQAICRRAES